MGVFKRRSGRRRLLTNIYGLEIKRGSLSEAAKRVGTHRVERRVSGRITRVGATKVTWAWTGRPKAIGGIAVGSLEAGSWEQGVLCLVLEDLRIRARIMWAQSDANGNNDANRPPQRLQDGSDKARPADGVLAESDAENDNEWAEIQWSEPAPRVVEATVGSPGA